LDAVAAVGPQQFKKGMHGIAGSISTDPKNTAGMGLGDDGGVSVAALNGKLIHHQKFDILEIHRIKAACQSRLIQGFNGVPAQAEEGHDIGSFSDNGSFLTACDVWKLPVCQKEPLSAPFPANPG
jgi:hypothetical protein